MGKGQSGFWLFRWKRNYYYLMYLKLQLLILNARMDATDIRKVLTKLPGHLGSNRCERLNILFIIRRLPECNMVVDFECLVERQSRISSFEVATEQRKKWIICQSDRTSCSSCSSTTIKHVCHVQ